jgi:hypothetical protein
MKGQDMDIKAELSKITPKRGDVVIVTISGDTCCDCADGWTGALWQTIEDTCGDGVGVLFISSELTIETVSEDNMRRAGWVRACPSAPLATRDETAEAGRT